MQNIRQYGETEKMETLESQNNVTASQILKGLIEKLVEKDLLSIQDCSEILGYEYADNVSNIHPYVIYFQSVAACHMLADAMKGDLLDYHQDFITYTTADHVMTHDPQQDMNIGYQMYSVYKFDDIYIKFSGICGSYGMTECRKVEQVFPKQVEQTIYE